MKKKKILIYGWFGENNLGDELLLESMIHMIGENVKNSEINVIASKPKEVKKNHKRIHCVAKTLNFSIKSIIKNILNNPFKTLYNIFFSDILIVAGGGAISDWNPTSTKDMFFLINIFSKLKKRVFLLGVGAGPINKIESFNYFKKILSKAECITVRDEYSLRELNKIGLDKVRITNDLVFNYPINDYVEVGKVNKIGLVLAPVCMDKQEKFNDFINEIRKIVNNLKDKYEVSIIPFQSNYDYVLVDHFKDIDGINIYNDTNDYWNLMDYFKDQDLIIGMRFHSIVLSLKMRKYIIPIVYHPKNHELIKEFGLENYMSSIGDGYNWEDSNIDSNKIINDINLIQNDEKYFENIDKVMNKKMSKSIEMGLLRKI